MGYSPAALFRLFSESLWCGGLLFLLSAILSLPRLVLFSGTEELSSGVSPFLRRILTGKHSGGARHAHLQKIFRFFEDLFFCLSTAVALLLLAFVGNEGRIRWVSAIGMLVGFLAFRALLGRAVQGIFRLLALFVRRVIYAVLQPFRAAFRAVRSGVLRASAAMSEKREERKRKAGAQSPIGDLQESDGN